MLLLLLKFFSKGITVLLLLLKYCRTVLTTLLLLLKFCSTSSKAFKLRIFQCEMYFKICLAGVEKIKQDF